MTKRQIKAIVIILQLFLIGALFLPVGKISTGSEVIPLSVFEMISRYTNMSISGDAQSYMTFVFIFSAAIIFSVLFLKERKNFGAATLMSALYAGASACFFSASKTELVDCAKLTLLPYIIILTSLVSMALLILGYFLTAPVSESSGK